MVETGSRSLESLPTHWSFSGPVAVRGRRRMPTARIPEENGRSTAPRTRPATEDRPGLPAVQGRPSKYLSLAQAKGLGWPLPEDTDEAALEALLFPAKAKPDRFVEPDYFQVHQELKRKGVCNCCGPSTSPGTVSGPTVQPLLRALPGVAGSPEAQCASSTGPVRRPSSTTVAPPCLSSSPHRRDP